jgi:hypothetical protein
VGLKLIGIYSFLAYADDVENMGDDTDTIKKITQAVIGVTKEVGLEIYIERTKYMLKSHHQIVRQNHDINVASRFFEHLAQFKYL